VSDRLLVYTPLELLNQFTNLLYEELLGSASTSHFLLPTSCMVKLSLHQGVEAHRVARRRGSTHFLDNRLTDGGEVVSLKLRSPLTPRKILVTHFC
jgi:hypothetical protein